MENCRFQKGHRNLLLFQHLADVALKHLQGVFLHFALPDVLFPQYGIRLNVRCISWKNMLKLFEKFDMCLQCFSYLSPHFTTRGVPQVIVERKVHNLQLILYSLHRKSWTAEDSGLTVLKGISRQTQPLANAHSLSCRLLRHGAIRHRDS